jgi:hypothetical protein
MIPFHFKIFSEFTEIKKAKLWNQFSDKIYFFRLMCSDGQKKACIIVDQVSESCLNENSNRNLNGISCKLKNLEIRAESLIECVSFYLFVFLVL